MFSKAYKTPESPKTGTNDFALINEGVLVQYSK